MRRLSDSPRPPRVLLAVIAGAALAVGGIVGGIQAASGSDDPGTSTAQERAAELERAKAVIVAGAQADVLADGTEVADRLGAALGAADGTIDDALRTQTMTTLTTLEGALAAEDHAGVLAAMLPARKALELLDDATRAYEVAAGRGATEAERARLAAEQEAQRVAADEAARAAAEGEAARAAAEEAARVAAAGPSVPADPAPVAGASTVPLAGTVTLLGWSLPGGQGATLTIDESTGECVPTNGYEDIRPGAVVTVYDEVGAVLATGALGGPRTTVIERVGDGTASPGLIAQCSFAFSASVPERPFYGVEVTDRGRVTFPLAQIGSLHVGL